MPWRYDSSTGELSHDGELVAVGYSGAPGAVNDPRFESFKSFGPIPRGALKKNHLGFGRSVEAAGTAGATLTTLAATAAAAASVKSSGGPAKPNTESYGNFGLSQAEIDQALGGNYRVPPAAKGGVRLGQQERIDLFYKNLGEAQAVATADEAHSLLSRTLTSVEDAHSGVSAVAEPGLKYTGRMYPPREDFMTRLPNGDIEALTKGQRILFGRDGSIQIFSRKTGDRIFNKDGGG